MDEKKLEKLKEMEGRVTTVEEFLGLDTCRVCGEEGAQCCTEPRASNKSDLHVEAATLPHAVLKVAKECGVKVDINRDGTLRIEGESVEKVADSSAEFAWLASKALDQCADLRSQLETAGDKLEKLRDRLVRAEEGAAEAVKAELLLRVLSEHHEVQDTDQWAQGWQERQNELMRDVETFLAAKPDKQS